MKRATCKAGVDFFFFLKLPLMSNLPNNGLQDLFSYHFSMENSYSTNIAIYICMDADRIGRKNGWPCDLSDFPLSQKDKWSLFTRNRYLLLKRIPFQIDLFKWELMYKFFIHSFRVDWVPVTFVKSHYIRVSALAQFPLLTLWVSLKDPSPSIFYKFC